MKNIPKIVKGLDPIADAFAGTANTDVISMKNHKTLMFLIYKGVSTGGTDNAVVKVQACDDFVPTAVKATSFRYQEILTGDTPSEIKKISSADAATGFTMTGGSSQVYAVYVDADDIVKADETYSKVRLQITEQTDDPVVASVVAILTEGRYEKEVSETAIA